MSIKNESLERTRVGIIDEPSSEFELNEIKNNRVFNPSQIVDRLTLIKAYETALRNQGKLMTNESLTL